MGNVIINKYYQFLIIITNINTNLKKNDIKIKNNSLYHKNEYEFQ